MEMVIEAIRKLAGVSCVFYFDPINGILAQKSDPEFAGKDLPSVGRTLEKIYSWGADIFSDVEQIGLQYHGSNMLVRRVDDGLYLIVIYAQALDSNLLNATLAQVLKNPKMKSNPAPEPRRINAASQSGTAGGASKRVNATPASPILSSLESSLNKVMGPMASIIFDDTRQAWIEIAGHPSRASIEKLVQMLCAEIGDPEKVRAFKNLIAPHLKSK
jgi:hypothetical protein